MGRLTISLAALLTGLALLTACSSRTAPLTDEGADDRVEVRFSVDVPRFTLLSAQDGIDENKILSLELLVFTADGVMVDYAKATVTPTTTDGNYTFKASIRPYPDRCVIHFVANRTIGGADRAARLMGRTESDVLLAEPVKMDEVTDSKTIPMWARKECNGIQAGSDLGTIDMLRSMAKFTVVNSAKSGLTEVSFALCYTYDSGSLTPFDPEKDTYKEAFATTKPTVPEENFLSTDNPDWASVGSALYSFERENSSAGTISCLIIKAKYGNDTDFSYYKLDLVDDEDRSVRYDLLRNHHYQVKLGKATASGATSFAAALAGAPVNNLALAEQFRVFPSYSDGKGRLEVEKTNFLVTQGDTQLTFRANYYSGNSTWPSNDKLQIVKVLPVSEGGSVTTCSLANGVVTANLQQPKSGANLISDIIIGVKDDPDLMRVVRVEVRHPFVYDYFKADNQEASNNRLSVSVAKAQNTKLTFTIKLPEDLKETRLPMQLRFFTENFYPAATQTAPVSRFSFGRKGDKSCWTTVISTLPKDRELTCTFHSNRSASAEKITVESVEHYFRTQTVTVTNPRY